MSGNVAERHHVSWHKKHREPLSICEQCCNTSKIKCGKAIRTPSRGLLVFFSSNIAFGWFLAAIGLHFPSLFHDLFGCWEHRCPLFSSHFSMDRFSEGWWWRCVMLSADVPFPVMIPLFLTFYHWLDVRDTSWLGSRNVLPEDPLNFLIWNFSRVSGGLCCENANRIRLACARSPHCETVSCVSNT